MEIPSSVPRDKTLLLVSIIGFVIALVQNVVFDGFINGLFMRTDIGISIASIIGMTIGNYVWVFFITYLLGSIANVFLKSKKGYWVGLVFAILINLVVRIN